MLGPKGLKQDIDRVEEVHRRRKELLEQNSQNKAYNRRMDVMTLDLSGYTRFILKGPAVIGRDLLDL